MLDGFRAEGGVDDENRSWAAAAYFGLANRKEQAALISELGPEYRETPLELAAKLFARGEPEKTTDNLQVFERNGLARKWLSILCGYAGTDSRTIDKRFSDLDLVRDAVLDDDPEIIEYSIWAEHKHPLGSWSNLRRKPRDLADYDNVRRWLYRLLTKNEAAARPNLDFLSAGMDFRTEPSEVAREGLALGVAKLRLVDRRVETMDWFQAETSLRVRLALVDHLAMVAKQGDMVAKATLVDAYLQLDPHKLLALKIESVSRPEWLAEIKRGRQVILPPVRPAQATGDLFVNIEKPVIQLSNGATFMTSNRFVSVSGSGNIVSGVNLGEMFESTIHAVANMRDQSFGPAAPHIEQFLRSLEVAPVAEDQKKAANDVAQEVAEAEMPEVKKGKLGLLKTVVQGVLAAPGATQKLIEDGQKLVDTITSLLS